MPELSVEERLEIAEEVIAAMKPYDFALVDMNVRCGCGGWSAFRFPAIGGRYAEAIAEDKSVLKTVIAARQKLAQEAAEAAKSERERRLEKSLESIAIQIECMQVRGSHTFNEVAKLASYARQALES